MDFAEFIRKNKDAVRRQSDSVTTKKINGVPVITANDEWNDEKEWDELYESLKGTN